MSHVDFVLLKDEYYTEKKCPRCERNILIPGDQICWPCWEEMVYSGHVIEEEKEEEE